jgi:hypothetical protein
MSESKKIGRKPKDESIKLLTSYVEFSMWQFLSKLGDSKIQKACNDWKNENGYVGFHDKDFCTKHNISRDWTWETRKKPTFKAMYHNACIDNGYMQLPVALNIMLRKYPDKWYQTVYPEEAQIRLKQKIEVDSKEEVVNLDHLSFEELYQLKYGKKPK